MMRALEADGVTALDLAGITALDTAGAWVIVTAERRGGMRLQGGTEAQLLLLETVRDALPDDAPPGRPKRFAPVADALERVGRASHAFVQGLLRVTGFFGLVIARLVHTLLHPSRLRVTALVFHMQQAGLNAVPIVALMAFLIGIVLAFQGADQLRQFGAEVFAVDLIAISVLRELGILLTAIIVAGRSASAFTAAIGSMKMREEIDAMRTLGLDPIEVLVLPRVLALLIMLPVLGFLADIAGLLGGAMMTWYELGISPGMFRTRLLDTDVSHFLVGIVKAPFFALIIGVIGCYQGMQVEGNADSLGRLTSRSVVQAIFMVILADATFSIFFAALGI
ncbi:ABC transporter permease [Paracoccaceae bacterium Fryx2]|nr:ABC transporter permease [Paracoccaceae bacterium Fryx2]